MHIWQLIFFRATELNREHCIIIKYSKFVKRSGNVLHASYLTIIFLETVWKETFRFL